jgi:hypothetical protein
LRFLTTGVGEISIVGNIDFASFVATCADACESAKNKKMATASGRVRIARPNRIADSGPLLSHANLLIITGLTISRAFRNETPTTSALIVHEELSTPDMLFRWAFCRYDKITK